MILTHISYSLAFHPVVFVYSLLSLTKAPTPWPLATTPGRRKKMKRFSSSRTQLDRPFCSETDLRREIVCMTHQAVYQIPLLSLAWQSLLPVFFSLFFFNAQRWDCTKQRITSKTKPSSSVRSPRTPCDKPCSHWPDLPKTLWRKLQPRLDSTMCWRGKR